MARVWRARKARKALHAAVNRRYEKIFDHSSGEFYYFNKRTGESVWEKPKLLDDDELDETPLWEHRWFVVEHGVLTQYLERFEDGEPETVMVEQVKMKRIQKVIVRPHNEVCLVTKFGEHRLRARTKNDCMDWAEAIAKWLDLNIIQTTQTKLNVILHRAEGLKKADIFGKSDPYVKVKVNPFSVGRGQEHRTRTIKNTLDPEWEDSFSFFSDWAGTNRWTCTVRAVG